MSQPPGPYGQQPAPRGPVPPYPGPPGDWHRYTRPPELARPPFQHAEPTPYHLMLRTWTYAWWRPVLGLLLLLVGMMVVVPVLMLPVLLVGTAIESGASDAQAYMDSLTAALNLEKVTVSGLLWLNLVLGAMVLWTWLLIRSLHQLRPRWLASVRPRIRWRFFAACLGLSVVALVAQLVVSQVVPAAGDPSLDGGVNPVTGKTVALILVVLLTTPLQAAGEEYVFRGYLLQAVGSLSRRAWVALLASAFLFACAHGLQNFPLFFDRFMFGLIAAWLVIRTGGLEAGIALHVLNNLLAFGGAILLGDVSEMLNVSEISWWNIPVTLTQSGVYVVLVLLVARRMGLDDRTRPPETALASGPVGA